MTTAGSSVRAYSYASANNFAGAVSARSKMDGIAIILGAAFAASIFLVAVLLRRLSIIIPIIFSALIITPAVLAVLIKRPRTTRLKELALTF